MLEYGQWYMGVHCKVLKTFLNIWKFFMIRWKSLGVGGEKKSSERAIGLPEMKIYYDVS